LKQSTHVLGSLSDKIRVPNEFVTAIETALGHHLQAVLTEHPEAAHEIISDLQTNRRGRASIAPLALVRGSNAPEAESESVLSQQALPRVELNCVPLPALEVVQSEGTVRPLLEKLLGSTRIVRDLNAATTAWRESQGAFHFVTLGGEVLSNHGVYTGGAANG